MSEFINPCGGKRWRTLPNGQIEVQGEGVPLYEPGSRFFTQAKQTWENWAPLMRDAAKRYGIPVSWLVGLVTAETGAWSYDPAIQATCGPSRKYPANGFVSRKCPNPVCSCYGLMQIFTGLKLHEKYGGYTSPVEMLDPEKNLDVGANMISSMVTRAKGELPRIASSYNAGPGTGGVHCQGKSTSGFREWHMRMDGNYVRIVLTANNTAIAFFDANKPKFSLAFIGAGIGLAGVGVAVAYTILSPPRAA